MHFFYSSPIISAETVAQSDACPTSDQDGAGLISAGSGNIRSKKLIMKYFLRLFSPLRRFQKDSCQFLAKECVEKLVNRLQE